MSIRGTILVQVCSQVRVEVSQYLTLSVKYPISLNRWSQLSVFTLKIQCPFEVQYWSKCPQIQSQKCLSISLFQSNILSLWTVGVNWVSSLSRYNVHSRYNIGPSMFQVRVRSVSVSHSFSQISYLFEPLESTECLHSQDTMSIRGTILVQVCSRIRVRSVSVSHSFSQISYLFEPLESTECLHSQDTMSIRGTILVQVCSRLESEVSQYLTLSVKYPISLNRWSVLSVFDSKCTMLISRCNIIQV